MAIRTVGLGRGVAKGALKPGDFYVERTENYALLVLAGADNADDTVDIVLGVVGEYYDDTKPPFQLYRSGVSQDISLIEGNLEIRCVPGVAPFLLLRSKVETLAVDENGELHVRSKNGVWFNMTTGAAEKPAPSSAKYDRWQIVWREGDEVITLAAF